MLVDESLESRGCFFLCKTKVHGEIRLVARVQIIIDTSILGDPFKIFQLLLQPSTRFKIVSIIKKQHICLT